MSIEKLTDEQRAWLNSHCDPLASEETALRIIDAQAEEIERLRAQSDGRHTANLALCAEIERLKAEANTAQQSAAMWRGFYEEQRAETNAADDSKSNLRLMLERSQVLRREDIKRADAAEARLADATALLKEARHGRAPRWRARHDAFLDSVCRHDTHHCPHFVDADQPAAATEPECRCDLGAVNCELHQPGSTEPVAPRCEECGTTSNVHKSAHAGWLCADPYCHLPPAPARTEKSDRGKSLTEAFAQAVQYAVAEHAARTGARGEAFAKYHDEQASYGGVGWEFHTRAATFCRDVARDEADQAVLDLMAGKSEGTLRGTINARGQHADVCRAELARRGLK